MAAVIGWAEVVIEEDHVDDKEESGSRGADRCTSQSVRHGQ